MAQIWNPQSLPINDTVNPYAFSVDLNGEWFIKKGAMIAYYGQIRFEALAATSIAAMVATKFSSPMYAQDWVVATGQGKLVLSDRGFDVNSYNLDAGNLTIRATNLLGFSPELELKQSIVPGFLTLVGSGQFLASSNGAVIFAEPPIRIDPQALLGWADCPSPSHHYDANWMHGFLGALQGAFGVVSGEERQFDFTGEGTVLIQSSEKVGYDPAFLRIVEEQTNMLDIGSVGTLHAKLAQRLAAQQQR